MKHGRLEQAGLAVALMLVSACAAHSAGARQSPESGARIGAIRSALLFPPEVKAFEISAGGVREEKEQWTTVSASNAAQAVATGFKALGIEVRPLADATTSDVEEVRALSAAVLNAVVQFTYATPFPQKLKRFEYSVGPVDALLDRAGADALVFVWGNGYAPTVGRQILNALVGGPPRQAKLAVALVDRSGAVLWFNLGYATGDAAAASLTDAGGAEDMTRALLAEFPRPSQKQ